MITWSQTLQTKCAGLSLQPVAVLQGVAKVFPRVTNTKKHGDSNPQPPTMSSDTLPSCHSRFNKFFLSKINTDIFMESFFRTPTTIWPWKLWWVWNGVPFSARKPSMWWRLMMTSLWISHCYTKHYKRKILTESQVNIIEKSIAIFWEGYKNPWRMICVYWCQLRVPPNNVFMPSMESRISFESVYFLEWMSALLRTAHVTNASSAS